MTLENITEEIVCIDKEPLEDFEDYDTYFIGSMTELPKNYMVYGWEGEW